MGVDANFQLRSLRSADAVDASYTPGPEVVAHILSQNVTPGEDMSIVKESSASFEQVGSEYEESCTLTLETQQDTFGKELYPQEESVDNDLYQDSCLHNATTTCNDFEVIDDG